MRNKLAWSGAIAMTGLLLCPTEGHAEGVDCAQPTVLAPDGRAIQGVIPGNAVLYFFWGVAAGRSYSVEARLPFTTFNQGGTLAIRVANVADCSQATATVNDTREVEPILGYVGSPADSNRRVSAVVTAASFGGMYAVVTNNSAAPQTYTLSVADTTLFSTAWSTNGDFNAFYSLLNTTNATCTGTLSLFNTAGTAVTTATLTIPAGATGSTNTQVLGTVRNASGTARFTHNCPPGAFLAEAAIANFTITPTPYFQFVHFQPTREATH
jgi:hypothetical protein